MKEVDGIPIPPTLPFILPPLILGTKLPEPEKPKIDLSKLREIFKCNSARSPVITKRKMTLHEE